MNAIDLVKSALYEVSFVQEAEDGVLVTIPCMYPSGGLVSVMVRGGPTAFFVSDEGKALRELLSACPEEEVSDSKLKNGFAVSGLNVFKGRITSPEVSLMQLPAAISLVANASRDTANWLFDHCKIHRRKDFKRIVREFLEKTFAEQPLKAAAIAGGSNKSHKFDNVVLLSNGKRLVVDAVVHDANSINAAVATNIDVRERHDPNIIQRIVYDDEEEWSGPDLALLGLGGTLVAFSRSQDVFSRFTGSRAQ